MSVSLMLKTEEGKAAGYVLRLDHCLLWSFKGSGEGGILSLLADDTVTEEIRVICDGCERETRYRGHVPDAAYVTVENALYAFTCRRARQAYEESQRKKNEERAVEEKFSEPCKKEIPDSVYKKEEIGQLLTPAREWGERRWPPPPCWPNARYCDGMWAEAGEEG